MKKWVVLLISLFATLFLFPFSKSFAATVVAPFTSCQVTTQNPTMDKPLELSVSKVDNHDIGVTYIFIKKQGDSNSKQVKTIDANTAKAKDNTFSFGPIRDTGTFTVDYQAPTVTAHCLTDPIVVGSSSSSGTNPQPSGTGNNPNSGSNPATQSQIRLIAPDSTITKPFKTLDQIQIGGLTPGKRYEIRSKAWDNCTDNKGCAVDNKADKGNTWYTAGSNTQLTNPPKDICSNGEAGRPDNQTDKCEVTWHDRSYPLTIYEEGNNTPVATNLTFTVRTGEDPNDADPGITGAPCQEVKDQTGKVTKNECITPFGAVDAKPEAFLGTFMKWGLGLAGLIAFLLILYGGFLLVTSNGDAEKVKTGRVTITSALMGLIFIVASVFLLSFIGGNILGINLNPPKPSPQASSPNASGAGASANPTAVPAAALWRGDVETSCRQTFPSSSFSSQSVTDCMNQLSAVLAGISSCQDAQQYRNPSSVCQRRISAIRRVLSQHPSCTNVKTATDINSCLTAAANAATAISDGTQSF